MQSMPQKQQAQHNMNASEKAAKKEQAEHFAQLLLQVGTERSQRAFAEIFKHFAPRLQSYATRQFGNEQTAMDLVQETMSNIWHKAHLFKADKGSASTWIFTIARNIRFDMLRRNRKRQNDISAEDLWPVLSDEADDFQQQPALDTEVLMSEIASYYNQLPDGQRIIIERIYIEGKSQQEVSDELGIPLGTVKSRTRLALQKLRELIVEHG